MIDRRHPCRPWFAVTALLGIGLAATPARAASLSYRPKATIPAHKGEVVGLAFDSQGKLLVSVGRDGRASIWNADNERGTAEVDLDARPLAVAASPTADAFFVVDEKGGLSSYTYAGQRRFAIRAHKKAARSISVSGNGAFVATGGDDGMVRLWDAETGREAGEFPGHKGAVVALVFEPGNSARLFSFDEKVWFVWDVNTKQSLGSQQPRLDPVKGEFHMLAAGAGPGYLAVGGQYQYMTKGLGSMAFEDEIALYRLTDNQREHILPCREANLRGLTVTPDGRFAAAVNDAGRATLWEIKKEELAFSIDLKAKGRGIAVSGDCQLLACGDKDGNVTVVSLSGCGGAPDAAPAAGETSPIIIVIIEPTIIISRRLGTPDQAVPAAASAAPDTPAAPSRFHTRSLRVRGKVNSAIELEKVVLNGEEITGVRSRGPGEYEFTATVPLDTAGERKVEIVATNAAGVMATRSFVVDRAAKAEATQPGDIGRRIALIVGVSRYRAAEISLKFADRDAQALFDLLTSPDLGPAAFRRDDVMLLLNEQATSRQINVGLREFVQKARPEDFVLFYFAGHGAPDPNNLQRTYLLAYDTDPKSIAGTGVLMADVRKWLAEIQARDVLVLADACHSAGIAAPEGTRGAVTVNPIHSAFLDKMRVSSGGFAILTASEKAQTSAESDKWGGHGVFTHFLLKGFRGEADRDRDRLVTVGEIMEYVRDSVKNETHFAQVPNIGPTSYDRDLPVVIAPGE